MKEMNIGTSQLKWRGSPFSFARYAVPKDSTCGTESALTMRVLKKREKNQASWNVEKDKKGGINTHPETCCGGDGIWILMWIRWSLLWVQVFRICCPYRILSRDQWWGDETCARKPVFKVLLSNLQTVPHSVNYLPSWTITVVPYWETEIITKDTQGV